MAVLLLASASGAPGVTTTALALALTWRRDVLLADCDRDPAQTVLAGWLNAAEHSGRGLTAIATAHRERRLVDLALKGHTIPLPGLQVGEPTERRFLPGFSHPGSALLFDPVWPTVVAQLSSNPDQDTLIDAGRVGREGLPQALLRASSAVLLVARSHLPALSGLRLCVPAVRQALEDSGAVAALGLLIVGPRRPYSAAEIEKQFEVPVWGEIDFNPARAGSLFEGLPEGRGFHASPYLRSVRKAASQLYERLHVTPVAS